MQSSSDSPADVLARAQILVHWSDVFYDEDRWPQSILYVPFEFSEPLPFHIARRFVQAEADTASLTIDIDCESGFDGLELIYTGVLSSASTCRSRNTLTGASSGPGPRRRFSGRWRSSWAGTERTGRDSSGSSTSSAPGTRNS
jgi:hypothetical protein